MASLAAIGKRVGIPEADLEELIELPIVAKALQAAAENPHWFANSIWKGVGRPTLYTHTRGLDLDALRTELVKRRELATRTTDGKIIEERHGHPVSMGLLHRAEGEATRRLEIIDKVHFLLRDHYAEPAAMRRAKALLEDELVKSGNI